MTLAANGTWSPITFEQVRAGLVSLWKGPDGYGANADTDANTGDGLLINMIAMLISQGYDVDTALWLNSFFRSAEGQSLDNILDLLDKQRDRATSSTAEVVFYGAPAVPVPALTTVITNDSTANRFATDELTAVGPNDAAETWVSRIVAVEVGVIYTAQVNAEIPSGYTALGGDTVEDIAAGLRDDINVDGFATAALGGVDASGNALIVVDIVGGGNLTLVGVGASGTVIDGFEAVRAASTATATGPLVAAAGTLQDLTNPIAGIIGVTNDADAVPGVDEQSDDKFRAEHLQTLFANASRTDAGMRAAVEKIGDDIIEVGVTSNRTESPVDSFGRPIHSVEVVYLAAEGADVRQRVADAIARQIPAGIEPYGLELMGTGVTVDGELLEVFATPVEDLYLWLSITLTPGESFPTSGDIQKAVKNSVAQYFDTGLLSTPDGVQTVPGAKLTTGKDMLREAAKTPINSVTNNGSSSIVITTDVTATPGGPPTLAAVDQPADPRQIIRADASRITVTVL